MKRGIIQMILMPILLKQYKICLEYMSKKEVYNDKCVFVWAFWKLCLLNPQWNVICIDVLWTLGVCENEQLNQQRQPQNKILQLKAVQLFQTGVRTSLEADSEPGLFFTDAGVPDLVGWWKAGQTALGMPGSLHRVSLMQVVAIQG